MEIFKRKIKKILSKACPTRYRQGFLILNYHSINPNHKYSTTPEDFDRQMKYLYENFQVIKLSEINNENKNLKIIITFDDGFFDNYEYAFPILKKYNLPATIFLVSDFIFNNIDITKNWIPYRGLRPLTQDSIREMSNSGLIDFGSHGKNHEPVSSLSKNIFKADLIESINKIQECSGKKVDNYAFPFGQLSQRGLFNVDFFNEIGLLNVCTTDWGINKNNNLSKFLKRIRIDSYDSMDDFKEKINGSWNFVSFFQFIKNLKCYLKKY